MRILKKPFEKLLNGNTRIIYCSKKGKITVLEFNNDDPVIMRIFDEYSIWSQVGGLKTRERRQKWNR